MVYNLIEATLVPRRMVPSHPSPVPFLPRPVSGAAALVLALLLAGCPIGFGPPNGTNQPPDDDDTADDDDSQGDDDDDSEPSELTSGSLVINEFMAWPTDDNEFDEWIELLNPGPDALTIGTLTLADSGGEQLDVVVGATIPAGGLFTLVRSGSSIDGYTYGALFRLDNSDDEIRIIANGQLIDEVRYDRSLGWTVERAAALGLGASAQTASANDAASSWCLQGSPLPSGSSWGTPGSDNDPCL